MGGPESILSRQPNFEHKTASMPRSINPAVRVLDVLKYYLSGLYRQANEKPIFLWAQAIAFKVLITIVPVVFLSVAILGQVLSRENPFETVSSYIREFLPSYRSEQVIDALDKLQQVSHPLTIIGIAALLFFAMTLFTTLRIVITSVFQEEWHDQRSIVGGYLFDLRMAGQVGLLFLLTIFLTSGLRFLDKAGIETVLNVLGRVGLDYVWLEEGGRQMIQYVLYLLPFVLTVAMFFQLFLFIPKPRPPKRSALLGAVTTAILWEIAKVAFSIYAASSGRLDVEVDAAGENAVGALANTFLLILAFVLWVYYSGVVLCVGAIVALLNEKKYRLEKKRKQAEALQARTALEGGTAAAPADEPAPVEAEGGTSA